MEPQEFFNQPPIWLAYSELNKNHVETTMGHIEKAIQYIGEWEDSLQLGVLVVPPTEKSDFYTLVTSGMSQIPMSDDPADDYSPYSRAELYMRLPPDWKLDKESIHTDKWGWPVAWLLYVAKFPHVNFTHLGWGDSFHLHPEAEKGSMGDTDFNGCILLNSMEDSIDADMSGIDPFLPIHYYNLFPAYKEEIEDVEKPGYFCTESVMRMQRLLIENNMTGPLNIKRKNVITNENH
jgi:hypothetical protein